MATPTNRPYTTVTSKGPWSGWKTSPKTSPKPRTTTSKCAPGYQNVFWNLDQKAWAYKTLANQTYGAAKVKRPTPTTLTTFANWVNKGAILHCATKTQITKWASRPNKPFKPTSATAVKNALCNKWGKTMIKAVCSDKNGKWLIATAPTWKGKPFSFPR